MAKITDAMPTRSEMRAPNMIADNTSRPWSSVPRGNIALPLSTQPGGSRELERLSVRRSNGLWGAITGANTAPTTHSAKTASDTIATGEWRKLQATSPSHAARRRARSDGGGASVAAVSFILDILWVRLQ